MNSGNETLWGIGSQFESDVIAWDRFTVFVVVI